MMPTRVQLLSYRAHYTPAQLIARGRGVVHNDGTFNLDRHRLKGSFYAIDTGGHAVLIPTVSLPVTGSAVAEPTIHCPNPTDYGNAVDRSDLPLNPTTYDLRIAPQNQTNFCYGLADFGAVSLVHPDWEWSITRTDSTTAPGLYSIRYDISGAGTWYQTDGTVNTTISPIGDNCLAGPVLTKTYAKKRTGANTIASIAFGYSIFGDLGLDVLAVSPTDADCVTTLMVWQTPTAAHPKGLPVTMLTGPAIPAGVPLIASHKYTFISITPILGTPNDGMVTAYNGWGYDGAGSDANPSDGLVTFKLSAARDGISAFTAGTNPRFTVLPKPGTAVPSPPVVITGPTVVTGGLISATLAGSALDPYYTIGSQGYLPTHFMGPDSAIKIPVSAGSYTGDVSISDGTTITINGVAVLAVGGVAHFAGIVSTGFLTLSAANGGYNVLSLAYAPAGTSPVTPPPVAPTIASISAVVTLSDKTTQTVAASVVTTTDKKTLTIGGTL